jgi:hypothetical protein
VYAKQKLSPLRSRGPLFLCLVPALFLAAFPQSSRADSLEDATRVLALKVCTAPRQQSVKVNWQASSELSVEPASALLPQWLSGYAFLFTMETNIDRAKEIRATLPANPAASGGPLRLRVDLPGDLAKLLGERVAVNARQAAILVHVENRPVTRGASTVAAASNDSAGGAHLFLGTIPRFRLGWSWNRW